MPQVFATAGLFIALISLLFTLQCWIANSYRPDPAIRLLGCSTLVAAIGMPLVLMRPPIPELVAIPFGNALNFLALGLGWHTAARIFGQRRAPGWLLVVPAAWLALCLVPWFLQDRDVRIGFGTVFACILESLALYELARRPVQASAHRGLLAIGAFHLLCSIAGTACVLAPRLLPWPRVTMIVLPFETMSYIVLWSGLTLTLIAERAILHERSRADHDDLSGVLNRRGFWIAAVSMSDRTILLFDIDHFKRINDSFGHATGDAVIRRFAEIATSMLGEGAVLGRVGGEEFAAALGGVSILEARIRADRVRVAFAAGVSALTADTTVSVGISADLACRSLDDQMALADRALYRAKTLGRDRVEVHVGEVPAPDPRPDQVLPDFGAAAGII